MPIAFRSKTSSAIQALVTHTLFLFAVATAHAQNSTGPTQVPPHDLIRYFSPPARYANDYGNFRSPLLFADGTRVRDAADWQRRRQEILTSWHNIMGPWPPLIERPLAEVVNETRREDVIQQQLRIQVALGEEMVDALLLLPKTPAPGKKRPAVIVVYYDAETGAGLGPPFRDYALQLAKRGFVTLSIASPTSTST